MYRTMTKINGIVLVSSAILIFAAITTTTRTALAFPFPYPYWSPFNQQQIFGNLWGNSCQNYYISLTNPNCGHITQSPIVQPPIPPIPPITQSHIPQPPIPQPQQSTTSNTATSSSSQCFNNICTTTNCINGACTTTGQPQPGQFTSTETCINGICTICNNGVCSSGVTRP